jgi:MFS family permease
MADICIAISSIITMVMELRIEKPPASMMKNIVGLLKMVEVDIFFVMIFCMGTIWGFLYNFLFLYLGELGGTKSLMGLTAMVANLAGIPILLFAQELIQKAGQINIILFGALMYTARMFVYSWIANPWWGLVLECLGEVCCLHLVWVAAATYINNIGGEGMRATMQGFIRLTHFSAGRSLGTFVGGVMISSLGNRTTFRILGIYIGAVGVVYYIIYQIWLKNVSEKRNKFQINRSEPEDKISKLNEEPCQLLTTSPQKV